jgi:protocatechuate 3,4-dioxygenase, beta subunit
MGTYSIGDLGRRELLKMSAVVAAAGMVGSSNVADAETQLQRTPGQILGPFYPVKELPQTSDLTRLPGHPGRAQGQVLNVMGRVLNLSGEPVANAQIESGKRTAVAATHIWATPIRRRSIQILTVALSSPAIRKAGIASRQLSRAPYPAGPNLIRPSHIHFQVTGRQDRLVTQMYFEGDPYNATDPFLNSAPVKNPLITKLLDPSTEFEPDSKMVLWDIVVFKG